MSKAIKQPTPVAIACSVALALSLVWPAWIASQNALSDLYARPAIDYLEAKRFDAYSVSEEEWQAIENNVAQADKLMPGNPRYLEALGLLRQLKLTHFDNQLSAEEIDSHSRNAKEYFQKAIESRPTWPYYWGNLALEYYRRGNYAADEYSLALSNASRFGPWKNDTQRLVMDLGSETWEFLSPRAKREFILSVERGLHRQPQYTLEIVLAHGSRPEFCEASGALISTPLPRLQTLCANARQAE